MLQNKLEWKYTILERAQVGLKLTSAQVKQFANKQVGITGARVVFQQDGRAVIVGIAFQGEESQVSVPCIAHKKQLISWNSSGSRDGLTWVVSEIELVAGKFKAIIALCKGKKLVDKRADLKKKALTKQLASLTKNKLKTNTSDAIH
jgi:SsrA-binding protein